MSTVGSNRSTPPAAAAALVHTPGPNDIFLGWETRNEDHSGNLQLKELIKERAEEYISSDYANAKIMIVRQVVEELTEDGGRFLCKSVDSGDAWVEAPRDYILENIKQAFRETVSSMTRRMPPQTSSSTILQITTTSFDGNDRDLSRHSPSISSMERSRQMLSSAVTVTPPARLSPASRLQPSLTKELLLRRLAQQHQQQQQQQIHQIHRASLSPLDEATRRRKLHMAKMQAMLQQKRQEDHQLMALLRDHQGGRSIGLGGITSDPYSSGGDHQHYLLGQQQQHQQQQHCGSLDAMQRAQQHLLPAQLRLTPLGARRQLDPLAPNRKRKRGSAVI